MRTSDAPICFSSSKRRCASDLIVTDGTTLLGADDKAGIAEIMTMAEYLLSNPQIKHGEIKIGFTPDEEVGRGVDFFDVEGFGADGAYTVDGGAVGELEYENFNAAGSLLHIIVGILNRNLHCPAAVLRIQKIRHPDKKLFFLLKFCAVMIADNIFARSAAARMAQDSPIWDCRALICVRVVITAMGNFVSSLCIRRIATPPYHCL